ncbi:Ribokinase [hydrothermal vent metagenome]|uniref:Ribokinase n=1 Tax=hydrothermal vent metagenome TaxID=652676 RepID=A0A3B0U529_9ZZZZ
MDNRDKIIIVGTGCALADFLYNGINFKSGGFNRYISKKPGDGGLSPGKLVFTEELEKYADKPYVEILSEITGGRKPDAFNVGGPSLVSLIHASQLLNDGDYQVKFYGIAGNDEIGKEIFGKVNKTPLNVENYLLTDRIATPSTDVFSDPGYHADQGERAFVNNLGASSEYSTEYLDEQFFRADIVCFGGTALVPHIHDNLTYLLQEAKRHRCITVVNTVFDFRNEKLNPTRPWPLVNCTGQFKLIDLMIMDAEEALRISGQPDINKAADFFIRIRVPSFIITNGGHDLLVWSEGGLFNKINLLQMPVAKSVSQRLDAGNNLMGDTTGCGDNFAGGVIASVAWQLKTKAKDGLDLVEAVSWGIASGGFCCFFIGGTYLEDYPGEKRMKVSKIYKEYRQQLKV